MHAVVPIFSLVGQLATELNESGNRKRAGGKFVGMLAKAKHQKQIHTSGMISTGELEKSDPLPPGRYWIDIFQPNLAIFQAWFLTAQDVVIENQESFEADDEGGYPARTWYLFVVKTPVAWGLAGKGSPPRIGWPTIAGPGVHTSDDTVQKPKGEDIPIFPSGPPDIFNPGAWEPSTKILVIGGIVLVVAIAASYAIRGFR